MVIPSAARAIDELIAGRSLGAYEIQTVLRDLAKAEDYETCSDLMTAYMFGYARAMRGSDETVHRAKMVVSNDMLASTFEYFSQRASFADGETSPIAYHMDQEGAETIMTLGLVTGPISRFLQKITLRENRWSKNT